MHRAVPFAVTLASATHVCCIHDSKAMMTACAFAGSLVRRRRNRSGQRSRDSVDERRSGRDEWHLGGELAPVGGEPVGNQSADVGWKSFSPLTRLLAAEG
jgi:hypothetical protein